MNGTEPGTSGAMRPIWFFVGCLLTVIGLIVAGTGLYNWKWPPEAGTRLLDYHVDIWWGLVILFFGLVLYFSNRNVRVE